MAVLSDAQIDQRLSDLPDWQRSGDTLTRNFKLKGFMGSVDFINRLAPVAEQMQHHPDLSIAYDTVSVSLSTHSEGGITERDFDLAARLDELA